MLTLNHIDGKRLTPEDQVKLAYLCLLRRQVDETGLHYWRTLIEQEQFDHKKLIDSILCSPEYLMSYTAHFAVYLHKARQQWIRTLEPFQRIFDVGGSSANTEMGALIELGYPHRPRELVIFDLPEEMQYWGKPKHPQDRDYAFDWGRVRYVHGFVEKIQEFQNLRDERFDCVFMGETIEHIDPNQLPQVFHWIREHLTEGGKFIFDTPNRCVTKLQMPFWYTDDDHKHEYRPDEMEELLGRHGFRVTKQFGLVNMPKCCQERVFDPLEAENTDLMCAEPETSYLFAFECVVR